MKIGIIDADLIGKKSHRFPNLACMKLSGFHKSCGHDVSLLLNYNNLDQFDKIYISKVFTETYVPEEILLLNNIEYGGTGFFYDKAESLPYEIEHIMPDYNLYNEWVELKIKEGIKPKKLEYYTDFSIGFTTRGCIRGCEFCVNKNSIKVITHSPIEEFLDNSKKKICLLDDNILASKDLDNIFNKLKQTKKKVEYKQGLDIRLLTDHKAKLLKALKYNGDYIFAFDNIEDYDIIDKKLYLWQKYNKYTKPTKLYVLCGFDRNERYDDIFWIQDIIDTFDRIKLLMRHGSLPYIMRYEKYNESKYKGIYINLARWCNQPNFYKKMSFKEFCLAHPEKSSTVKYMKDFKSEYSEIANILFNLKYENIFEYKE